MIDTDRAYARSIAMYEEACRVLAGGVSSNFRLGGQPVPLFFDRAEGARLYDVDGNVYIDYMLGMGPNILGHAPQQVVTAVADSFVDGQLYAGQHRREVALAQRLTEVIPCAELVRFGLTGSEMVQAAMRLARAHTGRTNVVKFEGHYHGWLDTILVSGPGAPLAQLGPTDAPVPHLPSAGQTAAAASDITVLPWNDRRALTVHLEAHADTTAAVLMEPILCNTSVILPMDNYLERVRALCDRYGVVLIFDEVITGFRVGLSGAQGRLGVIPDLSVFAKALGGGFPIAALAGKRAIMEEAGSGRALHGGTFNAAVPSVAAALATLDVLAADDGVLYLAMEARGERLMAGLRELGKTLGLPLRVQGLGVVFNTAFGGPSHVVDHRTYMGTDLSLQRRFLRALQDRGVRVTPRGTWFISAAHTDAIVDETLDAARSALVFLADVCP